MVSCVSNVFEVCTHIAQFSDNTLSRCERDVGKQGSFVSLLRDSTVNWGLFNQDELKNRLRQTVYIIYIYPSLLLHDRVQPSINHVRVAFFHFLTPFVLTILGFITRLIKRDATSIFKTTMVISLTTYYLFALHSVGITLCPCCT